ncbi:MAG: hypothetical protein QXP04_04590, partial [Candidatus Nanoarchaeia archaeon]|nr:hypothetical protein [Candidatus Jingweiarchaeum tengchongense]
MPEEEGEEFSFWRLLLQFIIGIILFLGVFWAPMSALFTMLFSMFNIDFNIFKWPFLLVSLDVMGVPGIILCLYMLLLQLGIDMLWFIEILPIIGPPIKMVV